jgi:SAM-dependent methyltransferase
MDPSLPTTRVVDGILLRPGKWPGAGVETAGFDVVTLIAVMEHIPEKEQGAVVLRCREALKPGGRVILTVPSPRADAVAQMLQKLGLIDGMALEEHYGFDVRNVGPLFVGAGFRERCHRTFELGFNHLFVFEREEEPR